MNITYCLLFCHPRSAAKTEQALTILDSWKVDLLIAGGVL